jgi:ferredoxin
LAIWKGRFFCDCLCPTGLALKLFAEHSLLGFRLNETTCLKCGACQKVCPASCLNATGQEPAREAEAGLTEAGSSKGSSKGSKTPARGVDLARCLLCLQCASVCPNGSLSYGRTKSVQSGRRRFLKLAGAGALAAGAYLTTEEFRARTFSQPEAQPIMPPGALSLAHFNAHCSICHTCVSSCPNQAIHPSHSLTPSLSGKPLLDPYEGFCQYDCVVCGEVCPTGALAPLTVEAKRLTRLGLAKLDRLECVVVKNGTSCGACAELCPTAAVRMAPGPSGRDEPTLDSDYCIGCGACQKACPVRPVAAIVVQGLSIQQTAKAPRVEITEDLIPTEDFPF